MDDLRRNELVQNPSFGLHCCPVPVSLLFRKVTSKAEGLNSFSGFVLAANPSSASGRQVAQYIDSLYMCFSAMT